MKEFGLQLTKDMVFFFPFVSMSELLHLVCSARSFPLPRLGLSLYLSLLVFFYVAKLNPYMEEFGLQLRRYFYFLLYR